MKPERLDRLFLRYRDHDDGSALARVFDLVATDLYRFALHLSHDAESAEDLVQATFLAAIERRDSYQARGKLFSWLAGILAHEWQRQRRRLGRVMDPERLAPRSSPDPADALLDQELNQRVSAALAGIPEPYRGVLDLRLGEELEAAAIARRLDRPAGTVRAQIHRGLDLLRKFLPAGLAGLVITALPRAAHARLREKVLVSAGFKPMTGLSSLTALKVVAASCVAVALGTIAIVSFRDQTPPRNLAAASPDRSIASPAQPDRSRGEPRGRSLPPTPAASGAVDATQAATLGWRAELGRWTCRRASGEAIEAGLVRIATGRRELPRASGKSQDKGAMILPSQVLANIDFGPLQRLDRSGLPDVFPTELAPRNLYAQIFLDGVEWGRLLDLQVERRDRVGFNGLVAIGVADRFKLSLIDGAALAGPPIALLQGRDGLVRRPFEPANKAWELAVEAPLPLEVELAFVGRQPMRLLMDKPTLKVKRLLAQGEPEPRRVRLLSAIDRQPISGLDVTFGSSVSRTHQMSMPLELAEDGAFALPELEFRELVGGSLLVRGESVLPQIITLRPLDHRGDTITELLVLPRPLRPGRLLDAAGKEVPGALVVVQFDADRMTGASSEAKLEAMTDENGAFALEQNVAWGRGWSITDGEDLDRPCSVWVQTVAGKLASFEEHSLREILAGLVLRMDSGHEEVELVVRDAEGEAIDRASITISVPTEGGEASWRVLGDTQTTDAEGRCRLHGVAADRARFDLAAPGRMSERTILDLPESGELEWRLAPAAAIEIELEFQVPELKGAPFDPAKQSLVTVQSEAGSRNFENHGTTTFDGEGRARILAARDASYEVAINLNHGARLDGFVPRVIPQTFSGVVPGSTLHARVILGRQRTFDLLDPEGQTPRSALIFVKDDPLESLGHADPWRHRSQGFGGSWQPGYPISLPLGRATVVVLAPGFRIETRTIQNAADATESIALPLHRGPSISGMVAEDARGRIDVINFELLEIPGLPLPVSWLESHERSARVSTTSLEDGSFRSPSLIPGRYRLSCRGQELGVYLLGNEDLVGVELTAGRR